MRQWTILAVCVLAVGALGGAAQADDIAEQGRTIFEANKASVITLRAVVSISSGGNERESEHEANATVIDPSGVAVLSLTVIDPTALYESFREGPSEMTSKVVSLAMIFEDGTEVPGEVVLRDKDLDLAFVRPTQPLDEPVQSVDIANPGEPQLLEQLVILLQLGKVARRAHSVMIERVETIIDKPRTFYTIGDDRARAIVCSPAFTLDGKFVGIGVMRSIKGSGRGDMGDNILVVIVPASDIQEGMAQVPARE